MKNVFYPKFPLALLPRMLGLAGIGALIAGGYGIMHDQFTYSISEEYFTKLKFTQFHYADFGFPRRVYVAEIGFLATWWVGLFGGWFIGRVAVPRISPEHIVRRCAIAFAIMFAFAIVGAMSGFLLGLAHGPDFSSWDPIAFELHVMDVPRFVRVAYIHNASYAGGFAGLLTAIFYVRRSCGNV
ncbi:MAG: hypothetical protein JWO95_1840 [Verrucomicrobiales bacterium]|nr:hypothetical protein [Verrucomicrobiales bacterium]